MDYIFYILFVITSVLAVLEIIKLVKSSDGKFTEDGWNKISKIGYETIDELIKLYNSKKDRTLFIIEIIDIIMLKVNNLPEDIGEFFTRERVEIFFKPAIGRLIDKLEKK